jgi:hypothetical protein
MQINVVLGLGLVLTALLSCQQGLTEDEVEAKIEARMAALGLSESATGDEAAPGQKKPGTVTKTATGGSPNATGTHSSSSPEGSTVLNSAGLSDANNALAASSVNFIGELTGLMADYEPELPDQVDNTDLLRCVTTEKRTGDSGLERLWKSLEKERKASAKERKQTKRDFFKRIYPVNFRIDYDWKNRTGLKKEVVYGCYEGGSWSGPQGSRSACINWCDDYSCWRLRTNRWVETPGIYLYSNNATPEPPELMKRMKAAGVQTPERFYCVVKDAFTKGKKEPTHWITCESPWEDEPQLRLSASRSDVRRGDLVSVPLAGVKRPEGVLLKVHKRWKTYLWTVDVVANTLKIEEKTTACPDPKEVAGAICRLADKKSDPMSVAENCTVAGDHKKLKEFAQKWHKRLRKNKNAVMIKATSGLMALTPDDLWAPLNHAIYCLKEKRNSEAIAALKTVHQKSSDPKMQLKVAEHGKKAGDDALYQTAVKKACDLGMQAACGLLGTE